MSITDELREYAGKAIERSDYMGGLTFDLRRIADRIDAALEEGYIELPKDADGQVWTGNELVFVADDGSCYDMCYLMYDGNDWLIDSSSGGFPVNCCHHVQPDSWERIIEDATALGAQMGRRTMQVDDLVERCKRLAGEGA